MCNISTKKCRSKPVVIGIYRIISLSINDYGHFITNVPYVYRVMLKAEQ